MREAYFNTEEKQGPSEGLQSLQPVRVHLYFVAPGPGFVPVSFLAFEYLSWYCSRFHGAGAGAWAGA